MHLHTSWIRVKLENPSFILTHFSLFAVTVTEKKNTHLLKADHV